MKMQAAKLVFAALALATFMFAVFIFYPHLETDNSVYFFAYGAALDTATMKARAGGFSNATAATASGFRLAFQTNKRSEFGVANLVGDPIGRVSGAVYVLSSEQFSELEKASGSAGFYRQIALRAQGADGKTVDAVTFVLAGETTAAPPSRPYLLAVSNGMREFGHGEADLDALSAAAQAARQ